MPIRRKLYVVDTISTFRIRYVVRAKSEQDANDEVILAKEIKEFSQKHIDESVWDTKEISEKEYIDLFNKDNDYLISWKKDAKMALINVIDYEKNQKPHSLK